MLFIKKWIYLIYRKLKMSILTALWSIFTILPIENNKVIFSNFNGGPYGDNPRFISDKLIDSALPLKLIWVSECNKNFFPSQTQVIKPLSIKFVYHMATAKIWIDNTRKLYYFKKRRNQYYIQTWHGGPGLKKVEQDSEQSLSKEYIKFAKRDSLHIDLFLSCCRWCSNLYQSSFWYNGKILECGIPKNDIYFTDPEPVKKRVREHFSIPEHIHIIMYAPTFRDNRCTDMYNLDYEECINALKKRFGGEWYFLVRLHPNVASKEYILPNKKNIINATSYDNMQELLVTSEVIITDYSGCAFDFIPLLKSGFLYAEDYDTIKKTRDYYFTLDELPFSLAKSNHELIENIINFNEDDYQKRAKTFLNGIQYFDTGHASEAVADIICRLTNLDN